MPSSRPLLWTQDDYAPELWTGVGVGPTLWTSPAKKSGLLPSSDGAALARAIEEARGINRQPDQPIPPRRTVTTPDADGHETLTDFQRLRHWSPAVTIKLISAALIREMSFSGTVATAPATLSVTNAVGNPSVIATLRRPTMDQLLTDAALGLKGAKSKKALRRAQADSIMAQATNLDVILLESLGRDPARHPSVYALLHVTLEVAASAAYLFKHLFAIPRPATLWGNIEPLIAAPGHASFPSGHAAQAYAAVEVLKPLLGTNAGSTPDALAASIAENRVIAGVHYPFDSEAGEALGRAVGAWVAGSATAGKLKMGSFNAPADRSAQFTQSADAPKPQVLLSTLWGMALTEIAAADKT
jgi:membrane-associated phospholipid phosphatase